MKALHTRDPKKADDPTFSEMLTKAGGVWFGGGRQWRFVDAYAGTLTEKRFHEVLARGGAIGGSSAGASIQSEYMPRGHPLGNTVMAAEGYERGFGFLPGCAVDQHFFARKRTADMTGLMKKYPQYLGIGIDEATAIVVTGQHRRGDRPDQGRVLRHREEAGRRHRLRGGEGRREVRPEGAQEDRPDIQMSTGADSTVARNRAWLSISSRCRRTAKTIDAAVTPTAVRSATMVNPSTMADHHRHDHRKAGATGADAGFSAGVTLSSPTTPSQAAVRTRLIAANPGTVSNNRSPANTIPA